MRNAYEILVGKSEEHNETHQYILEQEWLVIQHKITYIVI